MVRYGAKINAFFLTGVLLANLGLMFGLGACSQSTSTDIPEGVTPFPPRETPSPVGNPGNPTPFTLNGPRATPEQPAGVLSGNVTLSAIVTGAVQQAEFWVNGIFKGVGPKPTFIYTLDTTAYTGTITIQARAVSDDNQSKQTPILTFTVDNAPPVITSVTAVSGDAASPAGTLAGLSTFTVAATDASGIGSATFFLSGTTIGTATAAPYTISFDTTTLQNGPYNLTVEVKDATAVGNSTTSTVTPVSLDNGGAAITVTAPTAGQRLHGNVTIHATASDASGVTALVLVSPSGVNDTNASPSVFDSIFSTASLPDGPTNFVFRATNGGGKFSFKTVTAVVDNTPLDGHIVITPPAFTGQDFGAAVAIVPDTNKDGFGDVVLGSPNADRVSVNEGLAVVFHGPDFLTNTVIANPEPEANAHFGFSVTGLGDVDGDGYGDIAISAPNATVNGATNTGKVFVLYGPDFTRFKRITNPGAQAGEQFGTVISAGDMTGDGVKDLLITAPRFNQDTVNLLRSGRAYVVAGPAYTSFTLVGNPAPQFDSRFGESAAVIGDANGDGKADFVIGVPNFDGTLQDGSVDPTRQNMGRADIYYGPATFHVTLNDPTPEHDGHFAQSLAGADLNGDGHGDVLIGVPGANSNKGEVFYALGSGFGLVGPITRSGGAAGDMFGSSVAGGFDADGDGHAEFAVGAAGAGVVTVYVGPTFSSTIVLTHPGGTAGNAFGSCMSADGDVNHDGFRDLVVGASGQSPSGDAVVFLNR